jgi:hypothetical protein
MTSQKVFPYGTLLVPESEKEKYRQIEVAGVDTIPDDVIGLGRIRNYVLDKYKEEIIVMVDDDIRGILYLGRRKAMRITNVEMIRMLIENTAQMAVDLGVGAFGFNQSEDVRKFSPIRPFRLNAIIGCVVGVIGRDVRFSDDIQFKCDTDFSLKQLLKNRIIFTDQRYGFMQKREFNMGGNSLFRTMPKLEAEKKLLKSKWKKHVSFPMGKGRDRIKVKVVKVPR